MTLPLSISLSNIGNDELKLKCYLRNSYFIVCITCNFKWQSFSAAKHFAFVFFLMPITTIFLNLHVMDNLKNTHTHIWE